VLTICWEKVNLRVLKRLDSSANINENDSYCNNAIATLG
jgi:hypothetical protein